MMGLTAASGIFRWLTVGPGSVTFSCTGVSLSSARNTLAREAILPAQHFVNEFPQPLTAPSAETAIDRFPRAKFSGQQTPSASRPHKIEQTVEDAAPVGRRTTPSFNSGQQGFEEFPLSVAQIGRIQTTFSH